ncbi:ABC transporter permease [Pengzhenrongella frigida]|uniref:ABC transporter permease n=1 Tax=Pengzhenrongella frigida TaxID=1259133 RepID=A0A4Q5N0S1_9MICO|nr:ABC transporter permease [Cellulomonas sp. HLT2-17]RYV51649.1 ABC transporter permease [Cellulomonas sp. HLT2-17]
MNRRVTRAALVASIVRKDFREFSRDTLYIFLSVLGLVFFALTYYLVPDTVDETITLGIHQTGLDELVEEFQTGADAADGLDVVSLDTADHLAAAVAGDLAVYETDAGDVVLVGAGAEAEAPAGATRRDVTVGISFPDRFVASMVDGERPTVTVYTGTAVPPEVAGAMTSFVREIAYSLTGHELPVAEPDAVVLGPDRAGDQVSLRDRLRPMLVFFVLMIETFALSSLIASEVLNRTVTAVLVTPARVGDFLAAKTIYGTILTGGQALILLVVLRTLTTASAGPLLVTVLLGAVMFTGIAMITGSAGKDFIGTLFYNMIFILPLLIPTFSVLFPGTAAPWVQVMPSYPIIDALTRVTTYGAGWSEVTGSLLLALGWVAVIYAGGLLVLRRRVQRL